MTDRLEEIKNRYEKKLEFKEFCAHALDDIVFLFNRCEILIKERTYLNNVVSAALAVSEFSKEGTPQVRRDLALQHLGDALEKYQLYYKALYEG